MIQGAALVRVSRSLSCRTVSHMRAPADPMPMFEAPEDAFQEYLQ